MGRPKFSIIIPAHNSEAFIEKALTSVIAQSYRDYELIVVCDSCEDRTEDVARKYTGLVYTVDYGRDGLTRNYGLDHASGEYVLFMDDDDWYLHEFVLQMLADRIEDTSPSDIICFGFIFRTRGYCSPWHRLGIWPNVWSKCWRRSFIGDTRFSDEEMVSDLAFTQAMLSKVTEGDQMDYWSMPLYYYNYMRVGSQTEIANRDGNDE